MEHFAITTQGRQPCVGQKSPLKLKEIWAIRIRLQMADRTPELALFDLAIDSKLRACDFVELRPSHSTAEQAKNTYTK